MTNLEKEFDMAMMNIYHRAKSEASYNATRFLQMLQEHRGRAPHPGRWPPRFKAQKKRSYPHWRS